MGFDPWRGLRPRLSWLRQQPWRQRRRLAAPGAPGVVWGVEEYARAGMVLALVVLVVALIAIFAGRSGGANHAATPTALVRRVATTAAVAGTPASLQPAQSATAGAGGVRIHGLVLANPNAFAANDSGGRAALLNPQIQVAVEGGRCPVIWDGAPAAGESFAVELPDGCAPPGSNVYFRATGANPTNGATLPLQPFCVTTGDHPQATLVWDAAVGAAPNIDVRLTPGCADVPSTLAFVAPGPAAQPAEANRPEATFLVKLEPGFPGGVLSDEQRQLLAAAPGFPGGVESETLLASAATPPAPPSVAGGPPGATPPIVAAAPPGAANQPAVSTPPVLPPQPPSVSVVPPASFSPPPAPPSVSAPPVTDLPPQLPAPVPASGVTGTTPPSQDSPTPESSARQTLTISVLSAQGTPLSEPRVQAYAGGGVCDDESAAGTTSATVTIVLPGACQNLQAGSSISFKAGGTDPVSGPLDPPLGACPVSSNDPPVYAPVTFMPGGDSAGQTARLMIVGSQPIAGCPREAPAGGDNAGTMQLSLSVRAHDSAELFSSPSVRVYAGTAQCGEAVSQGTLVVHVTLPAGCAKPGDLLTFEAGGQDTRQPRPTPLTPACAFELVYGGSAEPSPAYTAVTFAVGTRFVPLILSALPGCPGPGAAAAQPADAGMTLTLSLIDATRPNVPLERPTVTVSVGGTPCARAASIDTPALVLTLPKTCGMAGAVVTFLVSALDPRFQQSGPVSACAIDPPATGQTAQGYHPSPKPVSFQPGQMATYGLLPGSICPAVATPGASPPSGETPTAGASTPPPSPAPATPAPTRTATIATPSPTPSPAPTPVPPNIGDSVPIRLPGQ